MIAFADVRDVLRRVDPSAVGQFLLRRGFSRTGGEEGAFDVYVSTTRDVLVVPVNREASDYARKLRDLVELFVSPTNPVDDVVASIVLPNFDIFRYRIETPETVWGHLRLGYTHEAMHALYDLLQYTAAGVWSQRADYRRVSSSAKAFAAQCQFGQTEYGSFVLKVFCPTDPTGAKDELGEPFGRVTTRAVVENLDFLASAKAEDPSEPLPPTLNRNVASAVQRLRPQHSLGASAGVRVRYSRLTSQAEPEPTQLTPWSAEEVATLDLGAFVFSHAQSIRDRLRKAEEFERELLRGYITELHKDRPTSATEQSHEITVEVKSGASWRQLRVRLLPHQYREAVRWHDANLPIDIDAVVDKRSKVWSVAKLISFRPTDPDQTAMGLFDLPSDSPPSSLPEM